MAQQLSHLMSEGRIGAMTLRNRIIVAPMGAGMAELDGSCGDRLREYHVEQARGGAGLVHIGGTAVSWPQGGAHERQSILSHDGAISGWAKLADGVHQHGAKVSVQLMHTGPRALHDMIEGRPLMVASPPPAPTGSIAGGFLLEELARSPMSRIKGLSLKVLTSEDIAEIVQQFASAAARAQRAGMDGVEIHGAHGYLLGSFVSPYTNKRDDQYGGSLENRSRFLLEVLRAVRSAVGPDYPVWCKIDAVEIGLEKGIELEDACKLAQLLEASGADAVSTTVHYNTAVWKLHSGAHTPQQPGANLPFAERLKKAVRIPIIASGRIEPEVADADIKRGAYDFVYMGRKLLADPHLPRKLKEGRPNDILPCIYCYTCLSAPYLGEPVRCAVNADTGLEFLRPQNRAAKRRRIVIIGGGPGGMEAARQLDAAGQDVILLEKQDRLGGTLLFAALAYDANEKLLNWLTRQMSNSQIDVRLSTDATVDLLKSLQPDEVLVATGATRSMPPIPGSDLPHVFSGDDMRNLMLGIESTELKRKVGFAERLAMKAGAATGATSNLDLVRAASKHWMPFGRRIAIIGGGLVGLELAEFLHERERSVTVVGNEARFGGGLTLVRRLRVIETLREHGVKLHPNASQISIDKGFVKFLDEKGENVLVEADDVIVAQGATSDLSIAEELKAAGFSVRAFGDCSEIGFIEGAMRGASNVVKSILGEPVPPDSLLHPARP